MFGLLNGPLDFCYADLTISVKKSAHDMTKNKKIRARKWLITIIYIQN